MQRLIEDLFGTAFRNPILDARHDSALLSLAAGQNRLAFSTDSYVVQPLFFAGSDIGALAVNGTVNDLAMGGARPLWLSAGFILEEGLSMATLRRVVDSMRAAADLAGVQIVTGDTKVVERGKGDQIFINTAGIGVVQHGAPLGPRQVEEGDSVLVSGDLGRHGMAIMMAREGLGFESAIESDCAPVAAPALALLEAGIAVHCMRDLTRGGLASALVEVSEGSGLSVEIAEESIPVDESVQSACELLGFDPLYVANEGRFAIWLPAADVERALEILRSYPVSAGSRAIGRVGAPGAGDVLLRTAIGSTRFVEMISGEQLPRIC